MFFQKNLSALPLAEGELQEAWKPISGICFHPYLAFPGAGLAIAL
jgi:hypothetical protein